MKRELKGHVGEAVPVGYLRSRVRPYEEGTES